LLVFIVFFIFLLPGADVLLPLLLLLPLVTLGSLLPGALLTFVFLLLLPLILLSPSLQLLSLAFTADFDAIVLLLGLLANNRVFELPFPLPLLLVEDADSSSTVIVQLLPFHDDDLADLETDVLFLLDLMLPFPVPVGGVAVVVVVVVVKNRSWRRGENVVNFVPLGYSRRRKCPC